MTRAGGRRQNIKEERTKTSRKWRSGRETDDRGSKGREYRKIQCRKRAGEEYMIKSVGRKKMENLKKVWGGNRRWGKKKMRGRRKERKGTKGRGNTEEIVRRRE